MFGSKMPKSTPTTVCLLRKSLLLYLQQAIYLFAALVSIRLWMIVSGRDTKKKDSVSKIEWIMVWIGFVVSLIPALLISLPQVIYGIEYVREDFKLFRCSQGYIARWQLIAGGLAFTVPSTIIGFTCLGVIIYHIVKLLKNSNINQAQRSAAMFMAMRVLILCIAVFVHGIYYILADAYGFMRTNVPWWSGDGKGSKNEHMIGHILISIWGLLFFITFGTTKQSRKAIMELLTGKEAEPQPFEKV